ncbi:MAG: DUF3592 domain-containing protein [Planctomycetota bacterium]
MRFNITTRGSNKSKPDSLGSKIASTVFFSVFGIVGTVFMVMMIWALIKKETEWHTVFFLIIPLIFMAVGFGGIYAIWFGKDKVKAKASKAKSAKTGKVAGVLFGLVFVLVGTGFSYWLLIRPLIKTQQAKSWAEAPCTIISAEVGSHSDSDGTTYSIDITYEYEFSGRAYRSDRYDFIGGSSSGRSGKQAVVDRYKEADNPVCFVNPENPSEAVLQRDFTAKNLIGLFPLIFVVAGIAVIIGVIKHKKRKNMPWLPKAASADSEPDENEYGFERGAIDTSEEPITLKADASQLGKLFGVVFFCLFWNGIVSVFVYQAIQGFRRGDPDWFLTLFMIPFVLIGLGAIGFVFYQILALFNPRYTLMLQPGQIYPGTTGVLGWQARGKASRVQHLSITLTGREEATYRVGTNTCTAKNTFFEMELVDSRDFHEIVSGQIGFAIPADTMHSFEADNNKIIWSIKVNGDIARWPDAKHSYKTVISPNPLQ